MARRFALDQNFPEPIVDALADWLSVDAELTPIRRIDTRMTVLDDWQVFQALHTDDTPWDHIELLAHRRRKAASELYERERLSEAALGRSPLAPGS